MAVATEEVLTLVCDIGTSNCRPVSVLADDELSSIAGGSMSNAELLPKGSILVSIASLFRLKNLRTREYNSDSYLPGYGSTSNTIMFTAALITTLSFAALLQPPTRLQPLTARSPAPAPCKGSTSTACLQAFDMFFFSNGMAMVAASLAILQLILIVPQSAKCARNLLGLGKVLVWVASQCSLIAFVSAAWIVAGSEARVKLVVPVIVAAVVLSVVLYIFFVAGRLYGLCSNHLDGSVEDLCIISVQNDSVPRNWKLTRLIL